jgi:hypothetical protein
MVFQKKFSNPQRIVVVVVGKGINTDVNLVCEHLSIGDLGVRILQVGTAGSERFDFGAQKYNTSLIGVYDMIIVSRFSVFCYLLDMTLVHF